MVEMDAFQITVVAGRHSGAVTKFGSGSVLAVGPGLANDIVLTDLAQHGSGLSAEVFRLAHLDQGAVRVFAIGASVQVNGKTVDQGAGTAAFLPCTVSVGAVKLLIEGSAAPADQLILDPKPPVAEALAISEHKSRFKRVLRHGTVGVLGCVSLIVLGVGLNNSGDTGIDASLPFAAEAATPAASIASIENVLGVMDLSLFDPDTLVQPADREFVLGADLLDDTIGLDPAVAFLEDAAQKANINTVQFDASDNIVVARGALSEAERDAWRTIPPAFDNAFNATYILLTDFDRRIPQTWSSPLKVVHHLG
jgi:hypothetical protein